MPYRFWTTKEIKFLTDSAEVMSPEEIAKKLNRTAGGIRAKAKELNLNIIRLHCNDRWPKEHLALFETHTTSQVAKLTGRTYNATWAKMDSLKSKLAA